MAGGLETWSQTLVVSSADAVSTTYTIKCGFQPIAIRITGTGNGTINQAARGDHRRGVGMGASATNRGAIAHLVDDSVGTTFTRAAMRDDCVFFILTGAGAYGGQLDIDAILGDGVRFILDVGFSATMLLNVQILGGEALTKAEVGTFQSNNLLGVQTVPLVDGALVPAVAFFTGIGENDAVPDIGPRCRGCMTGVMVASGEEGYLSNADETAVGTTENYAACLMGPESYMRQSTSGANTNRFRFDGFAAGEFSIDFTEEDDDVQMYMVIEGGEWTVVEFDTSLGSGDITAASGLSFRPSGAIFLSGHDVEDVVNNEHQPDSWSDGMLSSLDQQRVHTTRSEDAVATSNVTRTQREGAIYERTNSSNNVTARMFVKRINNDGLTCAMDIVEPSAAAHVTLVVFGPDTERPDLVHGRVSTPPVRDRTIRFTNGRTISFRPFGGVPPVPAAPPRPHPMGVYVGAPRGRATARFTFSAPMPDLGEFRIDAHRPRVFTPPNPRQRPLLGRFTSAPAFAILHPDPPPPLPGVPTGFVGEKFLK